MKLSKIIVGFGVAIASATATAVSGLLSNFSIANSSGAGKHNEIEKIAENTLARISKEAIAQAQQEIDRLNRKEKQQIALPDTGAQNDSWSCGPNSAARVLKFYGHDVDYAIVRAATEKNFIFPEQIKNPFDNTWVNIRTGTTPKVLQKVMQRWEGNNVKIAKNVELANLLGLLEAGKPVIGLIRVGSFNLPLVGTAPYLHWVAITGFDRPQSLIYFTDTNGQDVAISYDEFMEKWNLGSDGKAVNAILKSNGVEPRTIVWVDRRKDE